ncbi:hypothetical protein CPU12_04490 [Malaciobacter molluscorum LMG 25693]|uniref:RND family efflux system, outer membrane channel protein, TolC family n=1 Tax=Malaciobacter molluscorum LMG 25693 TaxID=870501 RepID=A0A2G1DJG4_9BACT|nr:TolC family protein [Malaciobacter molluscorum]AXX91662.1 RND family efflux system, outer membrane channel protein, TolC family [Malaciobacter molluscorum LMG 25693]PHO18544.1 hypothetical protein CPU12_04490 [Malaciobacter molluscorum LMG 25693]RXJ94627.1 hypothetical protein CRV00_06785 [Malaciobacter molluscorum]
MKKLIILVLVSTFVYAQDKDILSNTKKQIIDLKQKQIEQKQKKNKYDWITDITINGAVNKDDKDIESKDYSISLSQDIFRFGGISSQIQYAKELKKLEQLDLKKDTKSDLNDLYSSLIDIKIDEIKLEQNILNLQNSQIDVEHKKSEYDNGEIGITDLNDAIMTRNNLSDSQKQIELSKLENEKNINLYTTRNYKQIVIPTIKMISKKFFLEKSTSVNYAKINTKVNKQLYNIKKSDYLPKLSVDARYGYSKTDIIEGDDSYKYGLSISMPLSYTSNNDIEQKRLDYLISKQELNDEIVKAKVTYEKAILNIKNYEDRIKLAKQDIKLYSQLLQVNQDEYNAGYKTIDDVTTIKNSMKIRQLDIKTYKLNIKKQILNLYFAIN